MDVSGRGHALLLQPSRFLREIRFTLYEQGEVEMLPMGMDRDMTSDWRHDDRRDEDAGRED